MPGVFAEQWGRQPKKSEQKGGGRNEVWDVKGISSYGAVQATLETSAFTWTDECQGGIMGRVVTWSDILFYSYGFGRHFVSGLQGARIEAGQVAIFRQEMVQATQEKVRHAQIPDRFWR